MKIENLYIGKIETIIEIKKTESNYYTWVKSRRGVRFAKIINREFSTRFSSYSLVEKKDLKMYDIINKKKYPYSDVVNNYRSKELQDREIVSDYFEARELLPMGNRENISKQEVKKLFKQLSFSDIKSYFDKNK